MASTHATEEQRKEVFPFLDLPLELRLMVYGQLLDRRIEVMASRQDFGVFRIRMAYLFDVFHPHLLRINKQISSEYSAFTFRDSWLSITYAVDHEAYEDLLDPEEDLPIFPYIFDAVSIPNSALEKNSGVFIEYELEGEMPAFDSARGIVLRLLDMPNLNHFLFQTNIDYALVDATFGNVNYRKALFARLLRNLEDMRMELFDLLEDGDPDFTGTIQCLLCCPLYSVHPDMSELGAFQNPEPGQIPAPGLPSFGYATFKVHGSILTPEADTFTYLDQELRFDGIEYRVPFMKFSHII